MATATKNFLMSVVKKVGSLAAAIGVGLFLVGCNSSHNSVAPAAPSANLPFDAMVIRHTVADYDKWKPVFDADAPLREAAGVHAISVARGMENPNDIEIPTQIDDLPKARAFSADPRLKDVMQKGGVVSAPVIKFIHVLRMVETGKCNWAEVTCKVKDFDAWLKVFDGEGAATRKKDGLTDVVLARGIEDPNWVYLVFKINSVAEANAALASPARQKLMEQSGVEGKPSVYFGSDQ